MGEALAGRGMELVYGGGCVGLMGTIADAVLEARGRVIGVIPQILVEKEVSHKGLSDLRVVASMHERKALMAELADAFIALPGGFGTMDEISEMLTWAQLGLHEKPHGLLNVGGYYDSLLTFFDNAVAEGFIRPAHRAMVLSGDDPDLLLDALANADRPKLEKWTGRTELNRAMG